MAVWLELTGYDYACQPMDYPISTVEGRRAVAAMFGLGEGEQPLALLRIGRSLQQNSSRSPRLPATAFCRVQPHL
jgi:hypothetical protein